jgi:hypothetical protein
MKNKKQPPALKRVYWTAELKKVAIARLQGGVSWAELILVNDSVGLQQGILLFDTAEAAHAYISRRKEDFQIVVELPVKSIEKELLVRCQEYSAHDFDGEFRQWIYPNHIWFDSVKFHKFETVAEDQTQKLNQAELDRINSGAAQITLNGTITLPTNIQL